jgi:hypothetical protein
MGNNYYTILSGSSEESRRGYVTIYSDAAVRAPVMVRSQRTEEVERRNAHEADLAIIASLIPEKSRRFKFSK